MAALTASKDVAELASSFSQKVGDFGGGTAAASTTFYKGSLVMFDQSAGTVQKATASTDSIALGRCEEDYTTNASETKVLDIRCGIFEFENSSAGDAIANDDAGKLCYMVDDQTVALTDGTGTRSVAGRVVKVVSTGVFVAVNPLSV
jgi:hypothetical protein